MKKSTPLSERIKNYSLLLPSVIATSPAANAQVVYTDIDPDSTICSYYSDCYSESQVYGLDLNNDGIIDFSINTDSDLDGVFSDIYSVFAGAQAENAIVNLPGGPPALNFGYDINSGLEWVEGANEKLAGAYFNFWSGYLLSTGNWFNVQEKYLALRLKVNGEQFYGWVRLSVYFDFDVPQFTIHDYGYQAMPDVPVLAGCVNDTKLFADTDQDGYGDAANGLFAADCIPVNGYVADSTDCNDGNPDIHPNLCDDTNGIDNNCDGVIDAGSGSIFYYSDEDNDGYGTETGISYCNDPGDGYSSNSSDCDDANASINPFATETCNNLDDNCNNIIDDGLLTETYYADADNDSFGNPNSAVDSCAQPIGFITDNTDCDDTNANVNPDATEILFNGIDDDCDGYVDEFETDFFSSANSASLFSIFPNPTNGEFVIYLQLHKQLTAEANIEVINLLGQVVYHRASSFVKGKLEEAIKLNDEADGMYLVRVMVNDQVYCGRIVFEK